MKENKTYWKGLEQLSNSQAFEKRAEKEFPEFLPLKNNNNEPSRRDFLKMMGFSVAAVSLAACEAPIRKAIPYVKKPVDVDPGVPNYYASTYVSGSNVKSIVVKTREGRPIKIEGNELSPFSFGTSTQEEASVLSLYDEQRFENPLEQNKKISWEELDKKVVEELKKAKNVALITHTISSPTTQKSINEFIETYPNVRQCTYDTLSMGGTLEAYETVFGKKNIPVYDFSKANTIVSFGADFLCNGPHSDLYAHQFAKKRKLGHGKNNMSRLYVFESILSLTGSNADFRSPIKPSQEGLYLANLYNKLAAKQGVAKLSVPEVKNILYLDNAVKDLWASKGKSLVISGNNNPEIQKLVIAINYLLGNYHNTIPLQNGSNLRKGSDKESLQWAKNIAKGAYDGVIFYNCNPVYDHPLGSEIEKAISKISFTLSTSDRQDETSQLVKYNAPDHHFLESWNDYQPIENFYTFSQPTIRNIFNTRQAQDSFLKWSGNEVAYADYLKNNWKIKLSPLRDFTSQWNQLLQKGVYQYDENIDNSILPENIDLEGVAEFILKETKSKNSTLEVIFYQKSSIGDGAQANNPWLQEMPDPITKACWDHYVTLSPLDTQGVFDYDAERMMAQKAEVIIGGKKITLPVLPQPGQKQGTIGVALGYGRTKAGKVADNIGENVYPFLHSQADNSVNFYQIQNVKMGRESVGSQFVAQTQTSQTVMGRTNVIQEATLSEYQKNNFAGADTTHITAMDGEKHPYAVSLWDGHEYANHHWGMTVDLNACIGCGSCTIACQAENNIPVVGKQEVLNRREMHWIRIDRYYSHNPDDLTETQKGERAFTQPEFGAVTNPEVTFQPMMCQQCNNAPCETVCPVAATTHSSEGLNQMTYNRCVGTRYCANNCPYKVRRFNWFKYHDNDQFDKNLAMNNDLGKMVLNPDVTVRARGVMEKCSFCVQRIQSGKLQAKMEGRRPQDTDIKPACVASCSAGALTFGDMKNPDSQISKLLQIEDKEKMVKAKEPRAYHVLEELRVMPNVWYLRKIRNKDKKEV